MVLHIILYGCIYCIYICLHVVYLLHILYVFCIVKKYSAFDNCGN